MSNNHLEVEPSGPCAVGSLLLGHHVDGEHRGGLTRLPIPCNGSPPAALQPFQLDLSSTLLGANSDKLDVADQSVLFVKHNVILVTRMICQTIILEWGPWVLVR